MKVSGHAALDAGPETVFDALNDPGVLVRTIPGCERLEQIADDTYRMTVTAGVASIKGSYDGQVTLTDQDRPNGFTLKANGAGAPGTVDATVHVTLAAANDGTRLEYDADAVVGGMVGGVGQRMLTGVAKKTAGQFFTAVDDLLAGRTPEPVAAAAGETAAPAGGPTAAPAAQAAGTPARTGTPAGTVFTAPSAARPGGADDLRVPFWVVLAGVGAGAFWALAGVVVGYRVATGPRR